MKTEIIINVRNWRRCLMTLQVTASCIVEHFCWKRPHVWPSSGTTNASTSHKQRTYGRARTHAHTHGALTQSTTGCGPLLSFTPEPTFTPQQQLLHPSVFATAAEHSRFMHAVSLVSISDFMSARDISGLTRLPEAHRCTQVCHSLQAHRQGGFRECSEIKR